MEESEREREKVNIGIVIQEQLLLLKFVLVMIQHEHVISQSKEKKELGGGALHHSSLPSPPCPFRRVPSLLSLSLHFPLLLVFFHPFRTRPTSTHSLPFVTFLGLGSEICSSKRERERPFKNQSRIRIFLALLKRNLSFKRLFPFVPRCETPRK